MEQKAKLDFASEIKSPYDAVQLNLKGSCTADGSRGSAAILNVCAYNARTLRAEKNLDRLIDEVDQNKLDVIGMCETHRMRDGLSKIKMKILDV